MVWYSHLFKNLPQFVVIDTVKGFRVVNKAEIDVFLELLLFYDPTDVDNLISGSLSFLNPCLFQIVYLEVLGSHTAEAYFEGF